MKQYKGNLLRSKSYIFLLLVFACLFISKITHAQNLSNYDLQIKESDDFDSSVYDRNKWTDYQPGNPKIVYNTFVNPGCPIDIDSSNLYSYNTNIIHGTDVVNNKNVNVVKLDIKYDPVMRHTTNWDCSTPDTAYYEYTDAVIASNQLFRYGYFEICAKYPSGGIADAPAFWFWDSYNNIYSEIDVYEKAFPCDPFDNNITISMHNGNMNGNCLNYSGYDYNNPCLNPSTNCNGYGPICDPISIPTDPRLNYHIYGLDWEPSVLNFYLDGKLIKQYTYEEENGLDTTSCDYLGKHISIANLNIQQLVLTNDLFENAPSSQMPQPGQDYYYSIDYIKVYKIKPTIVSQGAICQNVSYEFDAYQYEFFDIDDSTTKRIIDDNYVWSIKGGIIQGYYDSPINSKAKILVTDSTQLTIKVTATEKSKNTTSAYQSYNPNRYSSNTKTFVVGSLPTADIYLEETINQNCPSYKVMCSIVPYAISYEWCFQPCKQICSTWETTNSNYSDVIINSCNYGMYYFQVKVTNECGTSIPVCRELITPCAIPDSVPEIIGDVIFNIFPNPSNSNLNIEINSSKALSIIKLIDMQGREVSNLSTTDAKTTIDTSNLNNGLYIVNVLADNKSMLKKVQIIH